MREKKRMLKREVLDLINGYALPKLLLGFCLWNVAIQKFEVGSIGGAIVLGVIAICSMMEATRRFRVCFSRKQEERKS